MGEGLSQEGDAIAERETAAGAAPPTPAISRPRFAGRRAVVVVVTFVLAAIAATSWHVADSQRRRARDLATQSAEIYSQAFAELRSRHISQGVRGAGHDHGVSLKAKLSTILGDRVGEHLDEAKIELYSLHPFATRVETGGLHDSFARDAWEFLAEYPGGHITTVEQVDGRQVLRRAAADRMAQSCVDCHNSLPASPKRDWRAGDVCGVLEVSVPMEYATALANENLSGMIWLGTAIVVLGTLVFFWLIRRLRHFAAEASRAAHTAEAAGAALSDEIEQRERSEAEREQLFQQLASASQQAGMGAMATSMIHNANNVINSVNISADSIRRRLGQSRASRVTEIARLLADQGEDVGEFFAKDKRGKALPEFLTKLGSTLESEHAATQKDVRHLVDQIDRLRSVFQTQQTCARTGGGIARLSLAKTIGDAIKINGGGFKANAVEVLESFDDDIEVETDSNGVMQIVVNLLLNAKDATLCRDAGARRICVSLEHRVTESGEPGARILVADNGVGISDEQMARMFEFGFTTKKDGHGFGLYSCSQVARRLGGSLTARSRGLGFGTTFALDLPIAHARQREALAPEMATSTSGLSSSGV